MQRSKNRPGPLRQVLFFMAFLAALVPCGCENDPPPPPAPVPEVATLTISSRSLVLTTELPGRTSPYLVAEIRPQVNGLIQERLFTEGTDVQAGQDLYQIDPAPFKAALDHAEANLVSARRNTERAQAALEASMAGILRQQATLKLARTNRERFEKSFQERAVSAGQRDQAVTEAEVAEASVQAAEAQVESDRKAIASAEAAIQLAEAGVRAARIQKGYTRITAPISGRIGKSNVTAGAIVTAYQPLPLANIQQIDPMYVDVQQSTADLLRLRQNLEQGRLSSKENAQNGVTLLLEDGRKYSHKGVFQFQDITVDPTTGSVTLRAIFPNPDGTLLPGMFVRASLVEGIREKAILVPQQAVSRDAKGNPFVLIVDSEGKVLHRSLTLDRALKDQWLVAEGLKEGEHIIVEGLQKARPGATVKEVSWEGDGTKAGPGGDA